MRRRAPRASRRHVLARRRCVFDDVVVFELWLRAERKDSDRKSGCCSLNSIGTSSEPVVLSADWIDQFGIPLLRHLHLRADKFGAGTDLCITRDVLPARELTLDTLLRLMRHFGLEDWLDLARDRLEIKAKPVLCTLLMSLGCHDPCGPLQRGLEHKHEQLPNVRTVNKWQAVYQPQNAKRAVRDVLERRQVADGW
jgi:hypothetical protein